MTALTVLAVTSEIYPFIKTGGLADVTGALPLALRRHGVTTVTLVPGYPAVMKAIAQSDRVLAFDDLFGGSASVLRANSAGLDLLVLDAPHLFDRPGNPYTGPDGGDWPDNAFRFGALAFAAARIALGDIAGFVPDVVHGHDWQAGLAMAYLAYQERPRPATVLTVHNLAYQGQFPPDLLERLALPPQALSIDGVEAYGMISFLKAGLQFADRITTVSPTYAQEIQGPENGCGLDGLLRARSSDLSGIRNGIDTDVWNPETDPRIASRFGLATLPDRAPNKAALQQRFGLAPNPDALLFAVISRMAWQKGLDLLADAVPALVAHGAQLAVLGTGEPDLERRLTTLAGEHRGQVGCIVGYDEDLAHLIQAGTDALLVPSRFEPCGLTQLCAMRYGAIPVVAKVGGLADTVADLGQGSLQATGFQFSPVTREALEAALRRAANVWSDRPAWQALQSNAMRADVSWDEPAGEFLRLYAGLLASKN
ncbi:MAG TPA: glycogen synthase GlgA [Xanthobacteraceae bacterium]|nr:glycogen synthase GlgA [Xanthobacteraceae bacterium]